MLFLYGFTWRVFRPHESWAKWGVALAGLLLVAQAVLKPAYWGAQPRQIEPHGELAC